MIYYFKYSYLLQILESNLLIYNLKSRFNGLINLNML